MKKFLLIALAGLLFTGATAPALALGPLDIEAELAVYSKNVWRGINVVDDAVLQPSLEVGLFGFELAVWGNMYLTDIADEAGQFSEVDYILGYELELALFELEAGFRSYRYPRHHFEDTTEFYVGGKVNVLLSPSLTIYKDIDRFKGAYWAASIGHGFGLGETMKLDLTGGLGLGSQGFISGYYAGMLSNPDTDVDASMTDFYVRAELPFHPIPFLSIVPSAAYTSLLGDARKALDNDEMLHSGKKENIIWGLSARFSF